MKENKSARSNLHGIVIRSGFLQILFAIFMSLVCILIPHVHELGVAPVSVLSAQIYALLAVLAVCLAILSKITRWAYLLILLILAGIYLDLYFFTSQGEGHYWNEVAYLLCLSLISVLLIIGVLRDYKKTTLFFAVGATIFYLGSFANPLNQNNSIKTFAASGVLHNKESSKIGTSNLPSIIHIILDEHASFAAIKENLPVDFSPEVDELVNNYVTYGFHVHEQVLATDARTVNSISHLFNGPSGKIVVDQDTGYWTALDRNDYFSEMSDIGYKIRVVESSSLNVCKGINYGTCYSYSDVQKYSAYQKSGLGLVGKWQLLLTDLRNGYSDITKPRGLYLYRLLYKLNVPYLGNGAKYGRSIAMGNVIDGEVEQAKNWQSGYIYYMHFLLPHYPYVFDANCNLIPELDRLLPTDESRVPNEVETKLRYKSYWEQTRCTHQKIISLVKNVDRNDKLKNAIILIHGDHGMRMRAKHMPAKGIPESREGYTEDSYRTLFMARNADHNALANKQWILSDLFKEEVGSALLGSRSR